MDKLIIILPIAAFTLCFAFGLYITFFTKKCIAFLYKNLPRWKPKFYKLLEGDTPTDDYSWLELVLTIVLRTIGIIFMLATLAIIGYFVSLLLA